MAHVCRAKAEKAAAAEAAHIGTDMETNMEEAERFSLPTGVEGRGPPDLALISRRIKETVRLLDTFKVLYLLTLALLIQLHAVQLHLRLLPHLESLFCALLISLVLK